MKNSVWPSAASRSVPCSAGMKLPPALFSTITVCLHVLAHLLGDQARHDVGAAAGGEADDDADRLAGLQFLRRARARAAERLRAEARPRKGVAPKVSLQPPWSFASYSASSVAMIRSRVSGKSRIRLPKRAGERVADRGAGRADRGFAEAQRRLVGVVDQLDLDLGNVAEAQDRIVVPGLRSRPGRPRSGPARSSTKLAPWMMPPSIWFLAPSGAMTRPASAAHQTFFRRISSSTSTSTTTAANEAMFL